MHLEFIPMGRDGEKNLLRIDGARITFRNFEGRGDKFNAPGKRNFAVIIEDDEIKDALLEDKNEYGTAWNVKIKPPREDGDDPFMFLKVNVKFNERGPAIYLQTGNVMNRLDEDSIGMLDQIPIAYVDLDIRPYDDESASGPFRAAYLQSMKVVQDLSGDRFASQYASRD